MGLTRGIFFLRKIFYLDTYPGPCRRFTGNSLPSHEGTRGGVRLAAKKEEKWWGGSSAMWDIQKNGAKYIRPVLVE